MRYSYLLALIIGFWSLSGLAQCPDFEIVRNTVSDPVQINEGQSIWQSFELATSNKLSKVVVKRQGNEDLDVTLNVYIGEGNTGAVIFSKNYPTNTVQDSVILEVPLSSDVMIYSGVMYTFEIVLNTVTPGSDENFLYRTGGSSHSPGIMGINGTGDANEDMHFVLFSESENVPVIESITHTDETCNDLNDGTATIVIEAASGTPGYTTTWSNSGGSGEAVTGLVPGDYFATVEDANGCIAVSQTITVAEVTAAVAAVYSEDKDETCDAANDGQITIIPTAGVAPFEVRVNNAALYQSDMVLTGLDQGTYSEITVKDATGCTFTVVPNPAVGVLNALANSGGLAVTTNPSYTGYTDGLVTLDMEGGSGSYLYSWVPTAAIDDAEETTNEITNLSAGTYSVRVTDAASTACTYDEDFILTEPQELDPGSIEVSGETVSLALCYNNANVPNLESTNPATHGKAPYTYQWEYDNGSGWTDLPTATTEEFDPTNNLTVDTYVRRRVTDAQDTVRYSNILFLQYIPAENLAISGLPSTICNTESPITVTGSPGGGAFVDQTGFVDQGSSTAILDPSTFGGSSVEYTYIDPTYGCTNSTTQSVTVNSVAQNASITLSQTYYQKDDPDITLTGNATPTGGSFSGVGVYNDGSVDLFSPSNVGTGEYDVYYTVSSNGCTDEDTVTITVGDVPTGNITGAPDFMCEDGSYTITATVPSGGNIVAVNYVGFTSNYGTAPFTSNNYFSSPTPGSNVSIDIDPGFGVDMNNPILEIEFISNYVFLRTVYVGGLPTLVSESRTTREVKQYRIVDVGTFAFVEVNPEFCKTGELEEIEVVQLNPNALGTSGTGTFSITGGTGLENVANTSVDLNTSLVSATTYTVTYDFESGYNNACSYTNSTTVTIQALPDAKILQYDPTICSSGVSEIRGSGTNTNGSWSGRITGNGIDDGSDFNDGEATFSASAVAADQNHKIALTYTDGNGCTNTDTVSIYVFSDPIVTVTTAVTQACSETTVALVGVAEGTNGKFTGTGISDIDDTDGQADFVTTGLPVDSPYDITFAYTDGDGCSADTTFSIYVNSLPTVSFSGLPAEMCVNDPKVELDETPVNGTFTYDLTPQTGSAPYGYDPANFAPGPHTVTYSYTNPITTCTNSETKNVTINGLPNVGILNPIADICYGDDYSFEGSRTSTPGDFTGDFFGDGISNFGSGKADFLTKDLNDDTDYIISYFDATDEGCYDTVELTVRVKALPVMDIATNYVGVCTGDILQVEGTVNTLPIGEFSGPGVVDANTNDGTADFDTDGRATNGSDDITFSYYDATTMCSNDTTFSVTIYDLPTPNFSGLPEGICVNGSQVELYPSPNYTGEFYYNNVAQPIAGQYFFDPADYVPGKYGVRYEYTDPATTCFNSFSDSVVVWDLPNLGFVNPITEICFGEVYGFQGSGTSDPLDISGNFSGIGILNYGLGNADFNTNVLDGDQDYVVTFSDTSDMGCYDEVDLTVRVKALPVIDVATSYYGVCTGDVLPLSGTANGLPIGEFSGAGVLDPNTNDGAADFDTDGRATNVFDDITYGYTDPTTTCYNDTTFSVTIYDLPTPAFTGLPEGICVNAPQVELIPTPDYTGAFYYDNVQQPLAGQYLFDPADYTAGKYGVRYEYTDPITTCFNSFSDSVEIYELPNLSILNPISEICFGEVYGFQSSSTSDPMNLTGDFSGLGIINYGNGSADFNTGILVDDASYTITYTDQSIYGCETSVDLTVLVHANPLLTISGSYTGVCTGDTLLVEGLVDGNPIGEFTGAGILDLDNNDGEAMFITDGRATNVLDQITFSYTETHTTTSCYSEENFDVTIWDLPVPTSIGLNANRRYCTDDEAILLSFEPTGGTFTSNGVSGPVAQIVNLTYEYTPELGVNYLEYFKQDDNGCKNTFYDTLEVFQSPIAEFSNSSVCILDTIAFTDESWSADQLVAWDWNLQEGVTSSAQDTVVFYNQIGQKYIELTVTTNEGCSDDTIQPVIFGEQPAFDFAWSNECFDVNQTMGTSFNPIDSNDLVDWTWDFGDGNSSTQEFPTNIYATDAIYDVSLIAGNSFACRDTVMKRLVIRPYVTVTKSQPYTQDFENGNGGWIGDLNAATENIWTVGDPSNGDVINRAYSGNNVLVTDTASNYNDGDLQEVLSPCFDFSSLERPMMTFRYWVDVESFDGVQILYTTDEVTWTPLGAVGEGYNWYNQAYISGLDEQKPGGANNFFEGFTGQTADWTDARIPLDVLEGESFVKFKIVLASNAFITQGGFAVDDIFIGERTRTILVEHFTNSMDPDSKSSTEQFDSRMQDNVLNTNGVEILDLQYHTYFPYQSEILANDYYEGPAVRTGAYGIVSVAYDIVDGNFYRGTTDRMMTEENLWVARSLFPAQFDVDLQSSVAGPTINVQGQAICTDSLGDRDLRVMVVLYEEQVTGNNPDPNAVNRNVVRQILPAPLGSIESGSFDVGTPIYFNYDWTPDNGIDVTNLNVAVVIQDGETKEVLQTMSDNILATLLSTDQGGETTENEFQLYLYPNPATTSFQILTDGIVQNVELYDMQGRLMKTYEPGVLNYDISDLFAGTYVVRVHTLSGIEQRKIVKE